jgi:hypothetical protein
MVCAMLEVTVVFFLKPEASVPLAALRNLYYAQTVAVTHRRLLGIVSRLTTKEDGDETNRFGKASSGPI